MPCQFFHVHADPRNPSALGVFFTSGRNGRRRNLRLRAVLAEYSSFRVAPKREGRTSEWVLDAHRCARKVEDGTGRGKKLLPTLHTLLSHLSGLVSVCFERPVLLSWEQGTVGGRDFGGGREWRPRKVLREERRSIPL